MSEPTSSSTSSRATHRGPKALIGLSLTLLLVAAGVLSSSQTASALSPNVAFSAVDLPTWQTNGVVYALGASNGRVVAGGTFSQIRPPSGSSGSPRTVSGLTILDAETGAPTSCQIPLTFSAGTASVRAITVSPDGNTVYIGGDFTSVGGQARARVAALDVVNCTVKPYSIAGVSGSVYGLAIHDDTLYLAGQFTNINGQTRARFAATNATTGALLPFVANADKPGRAIAVSPDGSKVALGGDITQINGQFSHSIAIVDAISGNNIKTYAPGFIPPTSQTKGIYSGDDGKFYVSNEGTGGGVFDGRFAVNWDTGEQVWRDNCLGATQATLEYLGTLYSASHAHDCRTNNAFQDGRRNFFLAQKTSDGELLGWYPNANDGTGEGIGPRAITVAKGAAASEDILFFGGEFTRINGQPQQGLTRFNRTDSAKPSTPQAWATTMADGSIQLRARASVDDDDDTLTYRVFRNGDSTPVWEGQGNSVWWKRPQVTFVDKAVTPGTTYRYVLEVTDGKNTARSARVDAVAGSVTAGAYETVIRNDSPASYWRSQLLGPWVEDSGAVTSEANSWSAIADGPTPSTESAVVGSDDTGSLNFDGSNDFLWEQNYRPGPNTYSAELWFKTTTNRGGKLIGFGNGRPRTDNGAKPLSGSYDRHVYMSDNGRLNFGVYTGSTTTVSTGDSYNDGRWHHVVATQGTQGMQLFVDSQLKGANPGVTVGQDYWGVWQVGGDNLNGWPDKPASNYFAGQIDEVGVYNSQLNRRQVTGHYQAGGGDVSINSEPSDAFGARAFSDDPALYWRLNDGASSTAKDSSYLGERPGTYGSAVTRDAAGIPGSDGNKAVSFAGNSDQVIATSDQISPPNVFTAEVWFNTSATTGGKLLGFENTTNGAGSSYDKQIYLQNDGKLRFGTYDSGVSTVESTESYNDGSWHQAVGQLSGAGMKLFVDGQLVAENGQTKAETGSGYWRIGGGNLNGWPGASSNYYFDGRLDEALIYNSALTPAQIQQHFLAGTSEDTEPPVVPSGVVVQPGNPVEVSWTASADNVGTTGYRVYRGDTANFDVNADSLIGETADTEFDDSAPLTPGRHYYRITAFDGVGNVSNPSAAVFVEVADTVAPTTPLGVTSEVNNSDATVTWQASTDDVGVTGYRVYRGATAGFTPASANLVGEVTTTSITDAGLLAGTYYYKVIALDAAGNTSAASIAAEVTVAGSTTSQLELSPVEDAAVYQSAPNNNYGTNTQLWARGTSGQQSFLRFDLPANPAGKSITSATLALRTSNDRGAGSTESMDVHIVSGAWSGSTLTWNNRPTNVGAKLGATAPITQLNTAFSVDLAGDPINAWTNQAMTLRISGDGSDSLRMWSQDARSDYRPVLVLTYGAGGGGETDTEAPSKPASLTADVDGSDVELAWEAATDNTGVTRYSVHRGATAGFEPSSANRLGTSSSTGYTNRGVELGTYFYKVVAFDAAGNASEASAAAEATIAQAPTKLSISVAADAAVQATGPDVNQGSYNQLYARGTTAQESFISFVVPAAPSGQTLSKAALRIKTSNDGAAGSTAKFALDLVSDNWSEDSVTWNNRPTTKVSTVGEIADATATNTEYRVTLDAGELASYAGTTVTVRIKADDAATTNNLRLFSSEYAASVAPQLQLTYS